MSETASEQPVRAVIDEYIRAVKEWDEPALRRTFHEGANIQHCYIKGDEVKTITLDEFIASLGTLHGKFDNAEEKVREVEILMADRIASVRLAFSFVMGPRTMDGQDLFNLALTKGEWKIVHKSYYL